MQAAMMKDALPLAAFGETAGKIFADIQRSGRRVIVDKDRPAFVVQTAEDYEKIIDLISDIRAEQIAAERLSKPLGKEIGFDALLEEFGFTEDDLKGWEDVEIE